MKIDKILYIVLFCLSFSSCGKWLTIEPTDQVSEEKLYADADGYRNQINGVYRAMSDPSLYGREMNWGLVDVLAQYYDFGSMDYQELNAYSDGAVKYQYNYLDTKLLIKNIWENTFNTIANCNDIIAHAEKADSMIFPYQEMERKMILGEAHALRAMLHFDMLRLFAPAPIKNDNELYIPYVKEFPTLIPMKKSTTEVLKNIMDDLEAAELMTAYIDTTRGSFISSLAYRLEIMGDFDNRFVYNRGYRLNHYAIKALIARVSLYAGDKTKASRYAEELINLNWFKFNDRYALEDGNTKLYNDVIFALYDNKLVDYYKQINVKDNAFLALMDYKGIFGVDGEIINTTDNREIRAKQWKYDDKTRCYRSIKINEALGKNDYCNRMIPMIRISEMYYIAAECNYSSDPVKAKQYLADVRKARGVKISVLPDAGTQTEFNKLVLSEIRRELYGEGQLFFFYKRLNLNVETMEGKSLPLTKEFVLPIPDSNDIN